MAAETRGILPRTLDYIFGNNIGGENTNFYLSYFQLYNEKIFDLLSPHSNPKSIARGGNKLSLDLREEKDGFFKVTDLRKVKAENLKQAYQWLIMGM